MKSFQVVINPTQTAHLILGSSPPINTVRIPPPDSPPHPILPASTSFLAHKTSSAFRSSAKKTPGHVVPALNNDLAMMCSCSLAQSLYALIFSGFSGSWSESPRRRCSGTSCNITRRLAKGKASETSTTYPRRAISFAHAMPS